MKTVEARDIEIGYHPEGFLIDITTSPLNYYTQWQVSEDGTWYDPKPVDFDVFPEKGWIKLSDFNWEENTTWRPANNEQ